MEPTLIQLNKLPPGGRKLLLKRLEADPNLNIDQYIEGFLDARREVWHQVSPYLQEAE